MIKCFASEKPHTIEKLSSSDFMPISVPQKVVGEAAKAVVQKYDNVFFNRIEKKKEDHTYRVFRVLSRNAEKFPFAVSRNDTGENEEV